MTTYIQTHGALDLCDDVVLMLRADGYTAYAEIDGANRMVVTNAPLMRVLLIAGHGQAFQRVYPN
jgi:hypothetical protein